MIDKLEYIISVLEEAYAMERDGRDARCLINTARAEAINIVTKLRENKK